jgi:sec-independent protein translocase protein TatB
VLNLDPAKLLLIAVVAVILLGPERLPQVARQVGAAWRTFNDFRHRIETDVRSAVPDLPSSHDISRLARSPTALLNHLSTMSPDGEETTAPSANPTEPGSSDMETPSPPAPAAAPEAPCPVEFVVSDPHLN